MQINNMYERWIAMPQLTQAEQQALADLQHDPLAMAEAFAKPMQFGTAGLRGRMAIGPSFLNRFTVAWTTAGLGDWLTNRHHTSAAVAIAYDSRHHSKTFAEVTAQVLAAKGHRIYLWDEPTPTPMLSWVIRHLNAQCGIVITASHNPAQDNGYKVYDNSGCQLLKDDANAISAAGASYYSGEQQLPPLDAVSDLLAHGTLRLLGDPERDLYLAEIQALATPLLPTPAPSLKVVYSALHGTGGHMVPRALRAIGCDVVTVASQLAPDGNFPTIAKPNPEDPAAFAEAIACAEACDAALIIATDPDCDRVGAAVRTPDGYRLLSGNQTGALLTDFLARQPHNAQRTTVITTNVSSPFGKAVARARGCTVTETLTGFKYIGQEINRLTAAQQPSSFLLGYEESFGYLYGEHARDKDAVIAAVLIAILAATDGDLLQRLNTLYEEVGHYDDRLINIDLTANGGMAFAQALLSNLRAQPPQTLAGTPLAEIRDYLHGIHGLPAENMLQYQLIDGSCMALRPSGTEPKIKCYINAYGTTAAEAAEKATQMAQDFELRVQQLKEV